MNPPQPRPAGASDTPFAMPVAPRLAATAALLAWALATSMGAARGPKTGDNEDVFKWAGGIAQDRLEVLPVAGQSDEAQVGDSPQVLGCPVAAGATEPPGPQAAGSRIRSRGKRRLEAVDEGRGAGVATAPVVFAGPCPIAGLRGQENG